MAVAHDAAAESHTGTTPSTSEASFTWNLTLASGARSVIVGTIVTNSNASTATSVTCGGVNLRQIAGASAQDTVGELGRVDIWHLDNPPTGTQAIVVNRTNNTNEMYAIAASQTCAAGYIPEIVGITLQQENQTPAEASINDGSPGTNSVRYGFAFSGSGSVSAGANSTLMASIIIATARSAGGIRETTAGQGARSAGFSSGALDDWACVLFALREVAAPVWLPPTQGPRLTRQSVVAY